MNRYCTKRMEYSVNYSSVWVEKQDRNVKITEVEVCLIQDTKYLRRYHTRNKHYI